MIRIAKKHSTHNLREQVQILLFPSAGARARAHTHTHTSHTQPHNHTHKHTHTPINQTSRFEGVLLGEAYNSSLNSEHVLFVNKLGSYRKEGREGRKEGERSKERSKIKANWYWLTLNSKRSFKFEEERGKHLPNWTRKETTWHKNETSPRDSQKILDQFSKDRLFDNHLSNLPLEAKSEMEDVAQNDSKVTSVAPLPFWHFCGY